MSAGGGLVAVGFGVRALVAVIVPLALTGGALSSPRAAQRRASGCRATVRVREQMKFVINRYAQDGMRFVPGTVTIKSGCRLTFAFATRGQSDPHSLSIVKASDLPRTTAQLENCKVCGQIGARHVEHPGQPPGPKNPIVHWIVNVGSPGLDEPGDSVAILEAKGAPPGHRSVTVPVSAPAGTILHFLCGVHPWMQGKIVVK
jgi:plastocyanin